MRQYRVVGPGVAIMLALAGESIVGRSEQAPAARAVGGPFESLHFRPIGPASMSGRISDLAVYEPDPAVFYVGTAHGGVWKTVNNGTTFEAQFQNQGLMSIGDVAISQSNPDLVWVGTGESNNRQSTSWGDGVYKSTDGGKTYANMGLRASRHINRIVIDWIDPDDPKHLVIGNDGGGAVSMAAGQGWSAQDFPTPQYYHVATTRHLPYHVCGAQQDGSTVCVPSDTGLAGGGRGGGGGRGAPPALYSPGGSEPGYVAPDPRDVDLFFAGGNNGSFLTRLNRKTGEVREVSPYPRMFSGEPSSALVERWQWTYPIIFSYVDPNVLYTSSQHVWRTTNGGQTWDRISGDLTRHDPKTMGESGGPITKDMNAPEVYGTVFALGLPAFNTEAKRAGVAAVVAVVAAIPK